MSSAKKLLQLREELLKSDVQMTRLLIERMETCKSIASVKKEMKMPIVDEDRERDLIQTVVEMASKAGQDTKFFEDIFRLIIRESIRIQKMRLTTKPL